RRSRASATSSSVPASNPFSRKMSAAAATISSRRATYSGLGSANRGRPGPRRLGGSRSVGFGVAIGSSPSRRTISRCSSGRRISFFWSEVTVGSPIPMLASRRKTGGDRLRVEKCRRVDDHAGLDLDETEGAQPHVGEDADTEEEQQVEQRDGEPVLEAGLDGGELGGDDIER